MHLAVPRHILQRMFWKLCLTLGLTGVWLSMLVMPAQALDPCDPPNILWNCNFDEFSGSPPRQVPAGWTPFVLQGDLVFMQDIDTVFGAPSLRMWSDGGTFKAGIHTRVGNVQPGVAYKASLGWGAPNAPSTFGRQLGIDPTGGTDPAAASVVWGPMHWGEGRIVNYPPGQGPNIDVSAVAQAETITLFILVDHNSSTGSNFIFIDAITLSVDPVQPAATKVPPPIVALAPTATALPHTPAATATEIPTATPTSTATATSTPTDTVTATPSFTPTTTPTPTSSPTDTPTATLTPLRLPTPSTRRTAIVQTGVRAESPSVAERVPPRTLLGLGLGILGGAGLLGGVAAWVWRRERRGHRQP